MNNFILFVIDIIQKNLDIHIHIDYLDISICKFLIFFIKMVTI